MNTIEIQKEIEKFITEDKDRELYVQKAHKHVILDYLELIKFNPDLGVIINEEPETFFQYAENAVELIKEVKVPIRIKNYHKIKSNGLIINEKGVEHLNKLWWVEGVVRVISERKPLVIQAKFECISCGKIHIIQQISKILKHPEKCGCGRKGKFKEVEIKKQDMMKLELEEDIEMLEGSEQPRRINVLLKEGLTNKQVNQFATPGKKVIITGILKDVPKTTKSGEESTEREWLFLANYIEPIDETEYTIRITPDDEKLIKEYAKDEKIYDKLVEALAPIVKGCYNEKLSLILQAFGGVTKRDPVNNKIIKRGYFHVGFIGDPATGKTSISKGLKKILPKCRSTSGKHASAAGLTWGANYDEFMKAWCIEAGAMVLANGGTVIVDEADKIAKEDLGKMNQGLEDGYFEASKMQIQATLRAETAGLFIANPKHGRFSAYLTSLYDECDIDPTLVSRLSMLFIFKDIADEKRDEDTARQIFMTHADTEKVLNTELKPDFIKKYIIYARKNCKPSLRLSQQEYIVDKYKKLRQTGNKQGRVAITPRQLDDIIRLSEAFAKIRLTKHPTNDDIDRAFNLMMYSLKGFAVDSEGNIDIDIQEIGESTETRNKKVIFEITLKEMLKDNKLVEIQEFVNKLKEKGFSESEVDVYIEKANKEGLTAEHRKGFIGMI